MTMKTLIIIALLATLTSAQTNGSDRQGADGVGGIETPAPAPLPPGWTGHRIWFSQDALPWVLLVHAETRTRVLLTVRDGFQWATVLDEAGWEYLSTHARWGYDEFEWATRHHGTADYGTVVELFAGTPVMPQVCWP